MRSIHTPDMHLSGCVQYTNKNIFKKLLACSSSCPQCNSQSNKINKKNKIVLSDSVSLKQYLLVQVHHTKKKLATSPASLKAFTAFPLHLPQLCCLAIFINMYNEKSHGCVRAIQSFHGCPTSPFCHNKFLIYAANYCHHVAKELIHAVDTVSSTFRLSDLYIKTLLFDRQTEI